jgi:hypothetical protein
VLSGDGRIQAGNQFAAGHVSNLQSERLTQRATGATPQSETSRIVAKIGGDCFRGKIGELVECGNEVRAGAGGGGLRGLTIVRRASINPTGPLGDFGQTILC